MEKKVNQDILRKRGRPAGKNRVPLSLDERRARNAQYERERREEMADAFGDLAASVNVSGSISNADLLALVITELQRTSQVKHSSDLDSLRRCNKNLMAQIEKLEQQLAESDDTESSERPTLSLTDSSRAVKRKRDDCESPVDIPVPKRSPRKCEPSLDYEIKQDQEDENPTPDCTSFSEEAKHSLDNSVLPMDPWLPVIVTKSEQDFPTAKESPVSSPPDQHDGDVDYSTYHFAGPQVPTPEYQLDTTVQPCKEEEYCPPSPWLCRSSPSSPEEQFSPSQYLIPDTPHGFLSPRYHASGPSMDRQQPPVYEVPVQPNVDGRVDFIPVHRNSSLPNVRDSEQEPRREGFLSVENLIAVYLSPMESTEM